MTNVFVRTFDEMSHVKFDVHEKQNEIMHVEYASRDNHIIIEMSMMYKRDNVALIMKLRDACDAYIVKQQKRKQR